ncbi:hypothetical protein Taro_050038, partial [Colocasia esculenta]|nr:hypothetical protein [Colocasia esculenta]
DSSMKASKNEKEIKKKCYMAHSSSKGSCRPDKSKESHMSEKSRNSEWSGVNAYKRSIKIQVQKIKKNTSKGHVSTARKFTVDRYTHPEQTSYWKLKWSSSCQQLKTACREIHAACRQPAITCRQIRPFQQDHGSGKPEWRSCEGHTSITE